MSEYEMFPNLESTEIFTKKIEELKDHIKELENGLEEIWKLLDTMDDFPTLIEVREICKKLIEKEEI